MPARYFQGSSVLGPVEESAARTFKEVIEAFDVCPTIPMNRADFLALDRKNRDVAKRVPFFTPATFKSSPCKRDYEHALHCNLIFLDIDPEKEHRDGKWVETGRYPAAPFVQNPALIDEALKGYNYAAYTTASSTPQAPRMRIVVDANELPIAEYPKAVATIGALMGLPSITRESSVAVQPMFLPSIFYDTPLGEKPLLTSCLDGRTFVQQDIKDSLDSFHGVHGKNGSHLTPQTGETASVDALQFLKAPVPEISLAVAKQALAAIDPDLDYHQWIEVAMALRHQFSPHKEEEAFELFDEWSHDGQKYGGEEETRAKWKSAKPSPNGRLPITIRTLLRRAVESGWDDRRTKETIFANRLDWMEKVPSVTDLMERGVAMIIATPLITAIQEDILITSLCKAAKKRFSHSVPVTAVRKDLAKAREKLRAAEEPPVKVKDPLWSTDVMYITSTEEFYRHRTGEKISRAAFNAAYSRHLLPSKKQMEEQGPITPAMESTPLVLPSDYALNKIQIPTAADYAYDPSKPMDKWFVHNGARYVNTYTPTYPILDPTRVKEAGELLMGHLTNLIAEPENRRHLLDFMAFQVQAPGRKIRWAALIQSAEGAGKTFLAEVMKAVLGAQHVKILDGNSIKSGWNEWCVGHQFIVIEEVKVSGTNKYEVMNNLKPLITNPTVAVSERFRNNREVVNISNYMIFSNHHDALALTPSDRRYFVIKSPLQTKQQVLALGGEYFVKLFGFLRDHPGAMRAFLADWEISEDFDPDGHAPRTKYVQDMVNDTANELTATIRRMLLEGDTPLVQYDICSAAAIKAALHVDEGIEKVTAQAIAQVLREEGLVQAGRHMIGNERHYLWSRPGMDEKAVVAAALERHAKGLTHLGMELLFL